MTIASIDLGTNTILLLIAQVDFKRKKIQVLFEDQKIPRIGEGLKYGFPISKNKEKMLLDILGLYKNLANQFKCEQVLVTATNAFRIASNRDYLVEKIQRLLNINVNVISGEEEARLTFLGCTSENDSDGTIAVIDIGGGSTEIAYGMRGKVLSSKSFPIGVVSLTENFFLHDPPTEKEILDCRILIKTELQTAVETNLKLDQTIAVAGTPTTLACIKKKMISYDETLVGGVILTQSDLNDFINQLSAMNSLEIKSKFRSIVDGREDVLLAGTILLFEMMKYLNVKKVFVSTKGVRYGVIYDFMTRAS
jgi:exopolyphosphatase / guanosine-5'-triphosphate,3'-diphosphate pyrophosphatase